MSLFWQVDAERWVIASGWAKNYAECYTKAGTAIKEAPDDLWEDDHRKVSISVTPHAPE